MSEDHEKDSGSETEPESGHIRRSILKRLPAPAIVTAIGALSAALIAQSYQSKMTALTMLSEREQAESNLRATMFSNLITPVAGPQKDREISPKREKLLVELLALNFHENFELKPLMEFVYKKLPPDEKKSLRSVARRITTRQIASLLKEGDEKNRTDIQQLTFIELPQKPPRTKPEIEADNVNKQYLTYLSSSGTGAPLGLYLKKESPDGNWLLDIHVSEPDPENENIGVDILVQSKSESSHSMKITFTLTPFDFPLTDNTLLADGNRFAMILDKIDINENTKLKTVMLRLIWFPKNYFTPRERPINYSEFRKKLGIDKEERRKLSLVPDLSDFKPPK